MKKHYQADITKFVLTNQDLHFTLLANGNVISERQFHSIIEAETYFEAFITSFPRCYLVNECTPIRKVKFGR